MTMARGAVAAARRQLARVMRDERGQTFTEYIMISGFIVLVGLFVMRTFQVQYRQRLQDIASYVINNAADLPW
jgi:Flp pilus assembly pilin Flp